MDWLIDTNLLVYSVPIHTPAGIVTAPQHLPTAAAIRTLLRRGETLWIAPQSLTEFYATLTRPVQRNGYGYTAAAALGEVRSAQATFALLEEVPEVYPAWERLIAQTGILGNQCFDVRLAALMQVYGMSQVLTFNVRDFARLPGIVAVDPTTI